jgi:1-acyl-sn-glycerol-3-phosphate acyltransferase
MVYHVVISLIRLWLHIRFRVKIEGLANLPEGGCILAMNHVTNYDAPMVGVHTPRKLYIMAKKSLFRNRYFGWLIREMGAFPVNRDTADIKSMKHSIRLIKEGNIFSLFIEGTRSKTDEMQEPKKGVGFLVAKTKSPVIPTYIYGLKGVWRNPAGVVFGKPLTFGDDLNYEEIAEKIAFEIQQLKIAQ